MVFDDSYNQIVGIGELPAFDFYITTTTNFPNPPDGPINPEPSDGSTVFLSDSGETDADGNPLGELLFDWDLPSTSVDATSYKFEFANNNNFGMFETTTTDSQFLLIGLSLDQTYYWKVTAINPIGETESSVWTFTAENTLSVEDFENTAIGFEFFINDGLLNISANQSFDQINIFDLSGKQIMNKNLSSNDENISFKA